MSALTDSEIAALDKLKALQRNWTLTRVGAHYEVTILSDEPPDVRRGDGPTIAEAVEEAFLDLRKRYA